MNRQTMLIHQEMLLLLLLLVTVIKVDSSICTQLGVLHTAAYTTTYIGWLSSVVVRVSD